MNMFMQTYNTNFNNANAPQNPRQNSSDNITNCQHYPKFHKPSTLSNQKYNTSKNAPMPTLQHDQSYNVPNSNNHTTK